MNDIVAEGFGTVSRRDGGSDQRGVSFPARYQFMSSPRRAIWLPRSTETFIETSFATRYRQN